MKTSQHYDDSAADEQAALWAARLDGDSLDRAQRAELDAWLARKPSHRALLSRYCQFSADLEEQIPALVEAGAVTMPDSTATPARRRWFASFPALASLTLAAAAAVAVTFFALRPASVIQNFATSPAQRSSQTLADGTRVELNANTSLRFDNSKDARSLTLAGGEALFVVAKDPSRPFVVTTPTGAVRVTGTTFNVRTDTAASAFEVTVVEGSVNVTPMELGGSQSSAPIPLVAGEHFSTRGSTITRRLLSKNDLDDALAWRQGKVVFRDTPLVEALAVFARYHGCSIRTHPAVAQLPLGGLHSIEDLKGFIGGLELALQVKVTPDLSSGAYTVGPR